MNSKLLKKLKKSAIADLQRPFAHLPLFEHLKKIGASTSLEGVRIIGCQHLMESTLRMFEFLQDCGLDLKNVSLLGKCYSTNPQVVEEMEEAGIEVSPWSTFFDSHSDFDSSYKKIVKHFFERSFAKQDWGSFKKIVLLDDGGYLVESACDVLHSFDHVSAVEQTSSGYELLKDRKLFCPVYNVARSPAKLLYESPMIADSLYRQMRIRMNRANLQPKRILIIGAGAIGKAMAEALEKDFPTDLFDIKEAKTSLESLLHDYDMLIGCTGKTSLPVDNHKYLKKGTILISASSSDREFDAVHLRKKIDQNIRCHEDLHIEGIHLLNAGFPLNFFGERNNMPLTSIQLTLSLLAAGIFEGCSDQDNSPGLRPLNPIVESAIISKHLNVN